MDVSRVPFRFVKVIFFTISVLVDLPRPQKQGWAISIPISNHYKRNGCEIRSVTNIPTWLFGLSEYDPWSPAHLSQRKSLKHMLSTCLMREGLYGSLNKRFSQWATSVGMKGAAFYKERECPASFAGKSTLPVNVTEAANRFPSKCIWQRKFVAYNCISW